MVYYDKLLLEKDSLNKVIQTLKDKNKYLDDNFKKAKVAYNKLKKEYDDCVENSKKENLRIRNEELTKELKSLNHEMTKKDNLLKEQDKTIKNVEQYKISYGKEEKERGREEIIKRIAAKYDKPFDTLVNLLTFKIVELDTSLLTGYNYNKQICIDVLNYFDAEKVLSEKFYEQNIAKALEKLKNINQTAKEIEELKKKLNSYKGKNDALKDIVKEIENKVDAKFTANDEDTEVEKLKIIYNYFYNYRFNMEDFPHITKVVLKIINIKERDANKSVVHLLDEL
jgi:DNA repair exonuclease SbcCD ATPase subunit